MTKRRRTARWLAGCAVGCTAVTVVLVVFAGVGYLYVRDAFQGIEKAGRIQQALVERHGEPSEFIPPSDGSIPSARLELFLSIRESLRERQSGLEGVFSRFPPEEVVQNEGFFNVVRTLKALADMMPPIIEYLGARNRLLLESEMGLGEYLYIYCLSYYSWLGHEPEDGPIPARGEGSGHGRLFGGPDSTFAPHKVRRRYRQFMLAVTSGQLSSLGEDSQEPWTKALRGEIRRFQSDPGSVLWQDGLPPALEQSLAPYKESLESTYNRSINCFELPLSDQEEWTLDS